METTRGALSVHRLLGSLLAGAGTALLTVRWWGATDALLAAWGVATSVFIVWCWWTVWPLDDRATAAHATREDPGRAVSDVVLLWIAAASLVSVVVVMFGGQDSTPLRLVLGLLSVAGSWGVVHTVHLLRYARLFYADPVGGLDFHDDRRPAYRDFAYLAMTVGTTFQVSDTDVTDSALRAMVMRHGVMSFAYSTLIIATTIGLVAQLGK